MSEVYLDKVTVKYPQVVALDRITLNIFQGEFLALLGPSGCGKTTTIKVIAGFIKPDEGDVYIDRGKVNLLPPHKRKIGMVFQNYALFPHKTVFGNIAFGLRMKREKKSDIEKKLSEVLKLLRLPGFENRYPHQLSGGQQQRVALARALVVSPAVLLLDEPLGALDKKLREEMQIELRGLQKELGITTVFVTHDQEEALTMADRIAILNEGKIEQVGSPSEIYENPKNKFVSDFIGVSNHLCLKVSAVGTACIQCHLGEGYLVNVPKVSCDSLGKDLEIAIRPEKIELVSEPGDTMENVFPGRIEKIIYRGAITLLYVKVPGDSILTIQLQNPQARFGEMVIGEKVYISWPSEACRILTG